MRRTQRKAIAVLAVLQLMAVAATPAQTPGIDSLVPARPVGFVNDFASLMDPSEREPLEDLLTRLRDATGAEITVVTLPSIGDQDEAQVALAIGRKWGVGQRADVGDARRNAGMVVLLVPRRNHEPGTGHLRIEVGRGLEGIVTDAAAGQIRREVMGPLLAREEYGPALTAGVRELTSLVARGFGVTDTTLARTPRAVRSPPSSQLVSLLPLLFFVLILLLMSRGGRRRRVYWGGGPWIGGGWGGGGFGGGGGGGFGGFGGGGGFSGGGSGGRF